MKKRIVCILLSFCVMLSLCAPALAVRGGGTAGFQDVSSDAYYAGAVQWAKENDITTGTSQTTFSPANFVTRGEAVTFLWRASGRPAPSSQETPFTDLAEDWYRDAVCWAAEKKITTGVTETRFDPNGKVTRGQMVTFLYRAQGEPGKTGQGAWYSDAVAWAEKNYLLTGTSAEFTTAGDNYCPRSDVVTYMYRALAWSAPSNELSRTARYGFLNGEALEKKITYASFMTMLDNAVKRIDADKFAAWKARFPEARQSQNVIDTGNAALALFAAAETIGGEVYTRNVDDRGGGSFSNGWTPAGFWGDVERIPVGFEEIYEKPADGTFLSWSSHYVTARGSVLTGNTLFSYQNGKTQLENSDLTYEDAALACLRLYESCIEITERAPTAEDAALLTSADARKQEILSSKTDVSYTGTAYYVSNSGSDSNDGKSPSTAWATIKRVVKAGTDKTLKSGDAVFFERGGLWRGEALLCAEGVIYSAYGTGDKPKIYGSEENYAGAEKWTLWYDQGGVKIWKLYRDVTEVGNIVFDGGESYATRVYSYYNGKEWVVSGEDQRPFDVVNGLKHDLTFYSTFELSKERYEAYAAQFGGVVYSDQLNEAGALYLRCDSGNPGTLYREIEFHQAPEEMHGYIGLVTPAGNNTIDNLCIKYCVVNGIAIYGSDAANSDNNGNVIQNCEVAWTGGDQHDLNRAEGDVMVCGEAIVWKTDNNQFLHNYVYQACCAGFVSEFVEGEGGPGVTCSGTVISGNVVEKCQDTFWFWDNRLSERHPEIVFWDNTSITDNYVLNMGYGWSGDPRFLMSPENPTNTYHAYGGSFAFHIGGAASGIRNMRVNDNVFYLTAGGNLLAHSVFENWNGLTFHGNTYVENDNRNILRGECFRRSLTRENTLEDIRTWLGDDAAVVFQPSAKLK